jgi:hypothetical protein
MKVNFNDLPLTLRTHEVCKVTGMNRKLVIDLADMGVLKLIDMDKRQRRFLRESIRTLMQLGPEGAIMEI